MKRHNILLFSYIIFAVICLVVRSFVEFETWSYVVSAVAISSAFLTYADLFSVHSKYYSDSCDIAERFIAEVVRQTEKENVIIEDICAKIDELKTQGIDMSQEEMSFETAKKGRSEVEKITSDFKKSTDTKRKKQKKYTLLADFLTFLAFLSFLCLITFTNIAEAFEEAQDIVSIIAFVVVLSSQYIGSIYSQKYSDEYKRHDRAVKSRDAAHEHFFEVQNSFNIYYEKVKDYAD